VWDLGFAACGADLGCRFAYDEFGVYLDDVGKFFVGELFEQGACGESAHLLEWLADGCQAGNDVRGGLDVVEAKDRDVVGNLEAGVVHGSYAADGGDIVETEDGGEVSAAQEELVNSRVAKGRGVDVFVELDDEIVRHLERKGTRDLGDRLPTGLRVGAEGLAVHVGDLAMAETVEMPEGEFGGAMVIEDDVGDAMELGVAGDRDGGCRRGAFEVGVDCEDAVDAARLEELGVFGDEVFSVAMVCGEEEVALLHEDVCGSAEHLGVVAFAEFGEEDADSLGFEALEGSGDEAGLVAELLCCSLDSFARDWGNGAAGRVVQHEGDGCGAEVEMFG